MSTIKVKNSIKPEIKSFQTKWDEAIEDAKEKIRQLHMTIRVYRARKEAGDSWPLREQKMS
jgi:hypothetical protein